MIWNFPNFSPEEFACQHCGKQGISLDLVSKLQQLRTRVDMPLKISSGYRCNDHPIEKKKKVKGTHNKGLAADILCSGADAHKILCAATELNFSGIGVNMKGDHKQRFIHLDISKANNRPTVWSY